MRDWLRRQMACRAWCMRCGSGARLSVAHMQAWGACCAGSGATPLLRENAMLLQAYVSVQLLVAVLVRPCPCSGFLG